MRLVDIEMHMLGHVCGDGSGVTREEFLASL